MKKIVIVDDSSLMRKALRKIYEQMGFHVEAEFSSGLQALRGIKEIKPDLVSLDIILPEMNGIEIFEHLSEHLPQVKVVVVSVLGNVDAIEQKITPRLDTATLVAKPFDIESIRTALESINIHALQSNESKNEGFSMPASEMMNQLSELSEMDSQKKRDPRIN